jgi:hypothetical protein
LLSTAGDAAQTEEIEELGFQDGRAEDSLNSSNGPNRVEERRDALLFTVSRVR